MDRNTGAPGLPAAEREGCPAQQNRGEPGGKVWLEKTGAAGFLQEVHTGHHGWKVGTDTVDRGDREKTLRKQTAAQDRN